MAAPVEDTVTMFSGSFPQLQRKSITTDDFSVNVVLIKKLANWINPFKKEKKVSR